MKTILRLLLIALVGLSAGPESNAQDWANLNRYASENAALDMNPPPTDRVVFMGDSITEAWSDAYPEYFEGKPYVNRGISGQTTGQMLVRFRQDVIQLRPSVVVILAGTNDIAENQGPTTLEAIAGNLKSMAELADANGIRVILASVLPAADYPWRPGLAPDRKIPLLNEMLQAYAKEQGFFYLDFFAAMHDGRNGLRTELTSDGVHLTRAGYEVMSGLVTRALDRVSGR